jgi:hypothetical protein
MGQEGAEIMNVEMTSTNTRTLSYGRDDRVAVRIDALSDGVTIQLNGEQPANARIDMRPGRRLDNPRAAIASSTLRERVRAQFFDGRDSEVFFATPNEGVPDQRTTRGRPPQPMRGFRRNTSLSASELASIRAAADKETMVDDHTTQFEQTRDDVRQVWSYDHNVGAVTYAEVYRDDVKRNVTEYEYALNGDEAILHEIRSTWYQKDGGVERTVVKTISR